MNFLQRGIRVAPYGILLMDHQLNRGLTGNDWAF